VLISIVLRAEFGWAITVPLLVAGSGLGLLVSLLNNCTLPISEEQVQGGRRRELGRWLVRADCHGRGL